MHIKLNFRRLLWLNSITLVLFLLLVANFASAYIEPTYPAPGSNIPQPLSISQEFGGQISGKYDNLQLKMSNCTTSQALTWNGSNVVCSDYSSSGGNLLSVLQAGANASNFTDTVQIGGNLVIGDDKASWNFGTLGGDDGQKIPILIATSSVDFFGGIPFILHGALLLSEEDNPTSALAFASTKSSPFVIGYAAGSGDSSDVFGGGGMSVMTGATFNVMTGRVLVLIGRNGLEGELFDNTTNFILGFSGVSESIYSERDKTKSDSQGLSFTTASNVRLSIANNGNIGIGTTNPSAKLDVVVGNDPIANLGGLATGIRSVAMIGGQGSGSQASGNYSFSAGAQAKAIGDYSVALGGASANGNYSLAAGQLANAYGVGSVALGGGAGDGTKATGDYSFAAGIVADANGYGAIALGYGAATGRDSFAVNANVTGINSIGLGFNTLGATLAGDNSMILGSGRLIGNNSILIGSGTLEKSGVIALMPKDGLVGVNNTNPTATLDIGGNIKISGGNPGEGKVLVSDASGLATWRVLVGGTGTIAYITSTLMDALTSGPDASSYIGGVLIGSDDKTWMNLGGAFTAGWIHSIGAGNNSFVGNVGIGTDTPNNKLQVYDLINFDDAGKNTFIGYQNGKNTIANQGAGQGLGNSALGYGSLVANTTGNANTSMGSLAMARNITGGGNTALGANALTNNSTGDTNIAIGFESLLNNTAGSANISIGYRSLVTNSGGRYNLAIGYMADVASSALNNTITIGKNSKVSGSNMMALGGTGADAVKVGIGTANPVATLDVVGNIKLSAGAGEGKILTSDANGLASWQTVASVGSASSSLLDALTDDADASNYSGGVRVGSDASTWMNLGGAFTAGWIHSTGAGNNSFAGNVGIGTQTPAAKLDVAGNIKIADGTQGAGKVLTSDASGLATWQAPTGGSYTETDPIWIVDKASYLTSVTASSTYLTQANAVASYLTKTDAAATYQPKGSYLTATPTLTDILTRDANASSFTGGTSFGGGITATGLVVNGGITATGNIGIGTTNPVAKLQVNGKAQFGTGTYDAGTTNKGISIANPSNTETSLSLRQLGQSLGQIGFLSGSSALYISNTKNSSNNVISGPYSIVLTEDGKVGIGDTTPDQKLAVNGTTTIAGGLAIGTTEAPGQTLDVNGTIRIRPTEDWIDCTASNVGTIRYQRLHSDTYFGQFLGCLEISTGVYNWKTLNN